MSTVSKMIILQESEGDTFASDQLWKIAQGNFGRFYQERYAVKVGNFLASNPTPSQIAEAYIEMFGDNYHDFMAEYAQNYKTLRPNNFRRA